MLRLFLFTVLLSITCMVLSAHGCSPSITVCGPGQVGASPQIPTLVVADGGNCVDLLINSTYNAQVIFTSVSPCSSIGKCGTYNAFALPGENLIAKFQLSGASLFVSSSGQATQTNSHTVPAQCDSLSGQSGYCNSGTACLAPADWSITWKNC